jgi:hypothetical protein
VREGRDWGVKEIGGRGVSLIVSWGRRKGGVIIVESGNGRGILFREMFL